MRNSKTSRRPYTGSKRFDRSCRNHGSCPWCAENRKHKIRRQMPVEDIAAAQGVLNALEIALISLESVEAHQKLAAK